MMERQLAHLVRLVDDLLDVSRISRNGWSCAARALLLVGRRQQRDRDGPAADRGGGHTLDGLAAARGRSTSTAT